MDILKEFTDTCFKLHNELIQKEELTGTEKEFAKKLLEFSKWSKNILEIFFPEK